MVYCDSLENVKWAPDFSSSGVKSLTWTKLVCKGIELCNSIKDIEWGVNPIQVKICDACGSTGCASGGYIKISKFSDYLIWTRPDKENFDEFQEVQYAPSWKLLKHGPIIIPIEIWNELRKNFLNLPLPTVYPDTTRADVADAWFLETKRLIQNNSIGELFTELREKLIASDTMEGPEVIEIIQSIIEWVNSNPKEPVSGTIEKVDKSHVETLYFDGPQTEDWPAFIKRNGKLFLGLRGE